MDLASAEAEIRHVFGDTPITEASIGAASPDILLVKLSGVTIIFPAFFIVVVFKMAANSRFVELNKKTIEVDTSNHFSLSYMV